ncbi:hypothetical protein GPECTOR_13g620 [Gonium pectorale]|uniref:Uncharacterized protein n=1 Tax=Gonium pectorale TaxID=33097 RepID=A0A150GMR4_GONPE|nr:hypothetical protein GPECTOR_13g620 [Gonium pectorale]|eukprot:KXZ51133.1 hypothetical protein GPECTOR_13g620 [Gonium pectorale]
MCLFRPARLVVAAHSKQQQEDWAQLKPKPIIPRKIKDVLVGPVRDTVVFLDMLLNNEEGATARSAAAAAVAAAATAAAAAAAGAGSGQ